MTKRITGTREWATSTVNCCNGCSHGCWYCYAHSMAARFGRLPEGGWTVERPYPRKVGNRRGRVMFPSTHDITPATLDSCLAALRSLLAAGNEVLVVSKPHLDCVARLCMDFVGSWRERVMFRFTIGSLDDAVLRFWEPGAPGSDERLACLVAASSAGIATSVSAEPMLDTDPAAIIDEVSPYVTDLIWLGRANQLAARLAVNHAPPNVVEAGRQLMAAQSDDWCRDLYKRWNAHPKVRFKDSIRRIVGEPDYVEVA